MCQLCWAKPLDRTEVERLAIASQPRLEAARLEWESTRHLIDQADRSPNPTLGLNSEAPALRSVSRVQLSWSQALETGGKRQARVHLAQLVSRQAELRQEESRRLLLLEARQAFAELLWADRRVQLEQEAAQLTSRQWEVAKQRYGLGDVPLVEVLQLEAEHSRRQAACQQAELEVSSRRSALASRLGTKPEETQVEGKLGGCAGLPELERLVERALQERPELIVLRLTQERCLAESQLEEARGVSDLTLQLGLAYDRTYISPADVPSNGLTGIGLPVMSVMAGLSLPLPIADDNSGNVEAARSRGQAALSEEQALLRELRGEVESAYWLVLANQKSRQTLTEQTLPLTARSLHILEEAYRVRARPLTDLLAARQAYLEARRSELEAARQEELALVRLQAACLQDFDRK
jgi:cobalt-zinc-cadmium efflux system outer membrane protein